MLGKLLRAIMMLMVMILPVAIAEQLAWSDEGHMHTGKIMAVEPLRVVIDAGDKQVSALVDSKTQIIINGKESTMSDLRIGSKADLVTRVEKGIWVAMSISVNDL